MDNLTRLEQSVDCSEMTGVDILMMVSVLLKNTVQRDILEPCHEDNDKLSLQSRTEYTLSCQASVIRASWYDAMMAVVSVSVVILICAMI